MKIYKLVWSIRNNETQHIFFKEKADAEKYLRSLDSARVLLRLYWASDPCIYEEDLI